MKAKIQVRKEREEAMRPSSSLCMQGDIYSETGRINVSGMSAPNALIVK